MNLQNCGLVVLADNRIKLKECEKKDKYLDFARELKKHWNMKVTIVSSMIGSFGSLTKGSLKKTARILRRVLETWGNLLSLRLQWKTICSSWCDKLSMSKWYYFNNNNNNNSNNNNYIIIFYSLTHLLETVYIFI